MKQLKGWWTKTKKAQDVWLETNESEEITHTFHVYGYEEPQRIHCEAITWAGSQCSNWATHKSKRFCAPHVKDILMGLRDIDGIPLPGVKVKVVHHKERKK